MNDEAVRPAPGLVVFDVGGTTIRDRGEVPAAFAQALAAGGIAVDEREIAVWRGASKRDALASRRSTAAISLPGPRFGRADRAAHRADPS